MRCKVKREEGKGDQCSSSFFHCTYYFSPSLLAPFGTVYTNRSIIFSFSGIATSCFFPPFFLLPFLAAHTSLSLPPFSPSLRHFLFSGKKGGETASRVHVVNSRERKKRRFHSSSPLLPWVDASPSSSSLPFFQKPVIFVTICGIVGLVHMPLREICCNRMQ